VGRKDPSRVLRLDLSDDVRHPLKVTLCPRHPDEVDLKPEEER